VREIGGIANQRANCRTSNRREWGRARRRKHLLPPSFHLDNAFA
jgi:hypothetical protein